MFLPDSKPHSRIMKVPNVLKIVEDQSGRAREKHKHEHNETKRSQFTSIYIEQLLSLNDSLWVILAAPIDIINKMDR